MDLSLCKISWPEPSGAAALRRQTAGKLVLVLLVAFSSVTRSVSGSDIVDSTVEKLLTASGHGAEPDSEGGDTTTLRGRALGGKMAFKVQERGKVTVKLPNVGKLTVKWDKNNKKRPIDVLFDPKSRNGRSSGKHPLNNSTHGRPTPSPPSLPPPTPAAPAPFPGLTTSSSSGSSAEPKWGCPATPRMCGFVFKGYEKQIPTLVIRSSSSGLEPSALGMFVKSSFSEVVDAVGGESVVVCRPRQKDVSVSKGVFSVYDDGRLKYVASKVKKSAKWLAEARSSAGAVVRLKVSKATVNVFGMDFKLPLERSKLSITTKRMCVLFRVQLRDS